MKLFDVNDSFVEKIIKYLKATPEERRQHKEYERSVQALMKKMGTKEADFQSYELSVNELELYRNKNCPPPALYAEKDALFYVQSLEYYLHSNNLPKYESLLVEFEKYLRYTWRNNSTAYFTYKFHIYDYYYYKTHCYRGGGTFDTDSNNSDKGESKLQEMARLQRMEQNRNIRFKK